MKIHSLASLAFAIVVAAAPALHARQPVPQCPDPCTAAVTVAASGTLPPGVIVFLVTPLGTTNGTGALLGTTGGGTVCNTCTNCKFDFVFSWNAPGLCVAYNTCGLLQQGMHGGTLPGRLTAKCGGSVTLKLEVGTCDPNYNGSCMPPPVIPGSGYTELWTLNCGNCH